MKIALIVAMGDNRAIGKDGGMPWRLPADLRHFRQITTGKPVIMGRRTFDAIGKPLSERDNIVVTRDRGWTAEGVVVAHDLAAALRTAGEKAKARGANEIMVIGGASLYEAFMEHARRIYITEIHEKFPADTWFPSIGFGWEEVAREKHPADEKNPVAYDFVVLERGT